MALTGGCLCGQVRYEVDVPKVAAAICHCTHCQKQSGSAFSILFVAPADKVTTKGTLKTYHDTADSGAKIDRQFCPECGSPIFTKMLAQPQVTVVKAGTLDDTSILKPRAHVWCDSAQSWFKIDEALPRFPKNPPG